MTALLTDEERALIYDLGQIWNRLCAVVGFDVTREGDMAEIIIHVHALQQVLMAQAAARAYPHEYRLAGERVIDASGETPA